jgi:hypothetical protein
MHITPKQQMEHNGLDNMAQYMYIIRAFDSCLNIGSTAAYGRVGMRLIDTDNYGTYTMTLTQG